jgi:Ser/Thr protein kinase RdoA (MazF antagonist)
LTLAQIVRGFGIEPDAIRFIRRRYNAHWLVRAGQRRYVLRRFGSWRGEAEALWEVDLVRRLADAGVPVAAPIGPPRRLDGSLYILMPFLPGRALGARAVDDAGYRALGRHLADYHAAIAELPAPSQRPGWTEYVAGALPAAGGAEKRAALLKALGSADAKLARRFTVAAARLEARDLPGLHADAPRMVVQCDFSPWNVRVRGGRLVGLLDFEGAHVDVRATDIAWARRGYHDAVVDGYLERAKLTDAELASLDGLWLGGVFAGLWRVLEDRVAEGSELTHGLSWNLEQLDKTRPYRS